MQKLHPLATPLSNEYLLEQATVQRVHTYTIEDQTIHALRLSCPKGIVVANCTRPEMMADLLHAHNINEPHELEGKQLIAQFCARKLIGLGTL